MRIGAFELEEPLPELREPHAIAMLRPWIDVGQAGYITLSRMERHYRARALGKLARPGLFYDFTRYRPTIFWEQSNRRISIPNSAILWARRQEPPDLLFFHLLEPHQNGEDYCESIVEVLKTFNAKRYVQVGGMYAPVPHTRPLKLSGLAPAGLVEQIKVLSSTYQGPTSITFLITQSASAMGMETVSMIVNLPQYAQLEEDLAGAARLLEAMSVMYGLPPGVIRRELGKRQYQQLDTAVTGDPQARELVQQLEQAYDAEVAPEPKLGGGLAPDVESFLSEMGKKLEDEDGEGA